MAGKQHSKHKTIAIYDYFATRVGSDEKSSVTVENIQNYLNELYDDKFERKSIYADIAAINEYKSMISGGDKDWIEHRGKNQYIRNAAPGEFSMDEVHLLLDAVNATPITDDKIADKIRKNWASYFEHEDYVSFMACERQKPTRAFVSLMNSIRKAIKNKSVLKIKYGYKLTDKDPNNCIENDRVISPLALYFEENKYYLFAIDNDVFEAVSGEEKNRETALKKALRQFRIDRISNKVEAAKGVQYIDCDQSIVRNKINGAVDAYSEGRAVDLAVTLEGEPKLLVKAFNYLRNELTVKGMINDNWSNGKLSFFIEVDPSPRFFSFLTNLASFDDNGEELKIKIDGSKELHKAYEEFLTKARDQISFTDKD